MFGLLSMFLTAPFYRKLSLRSGLTIAGTLIAVSFALYGLSTSYFAYLFAAAVTGLGWGLGTMIPTALLLDRWFISKRTTAIGICYASTGLSTLGIPSLLTSMVESMGLRTTFLIESAGTILIVLVAFLLLRNDPAQIGLQPYCYNAQQKQLLSERPPIHLTKLQWGFLIPMAVCTGAITNVGYSHLSVLTNANGFDPHTTALAIMVSGITLTCIKLVFGQLTDRLSMYRCNWLFGVLLLLGFVLLCVMGTHKVLLFVGITTLSAGLVLGTVGLTTWAGDLSGSKQYESTVRRFQISYASGGLIFSSIPGILADHFNGSYVPAYMMFFLCALFILVTIQIIYRKILLH